MTHDSPQLGAIILAAGKGTRMGGDLPKVAHVAHGRAMIWWVVQAVRKVGVKPIVLIVGHGEDIVRDIFKDDDEDLIFVTQEEQLGTGHATLCAKDAFAGFTGNVFVLAGDGPLIRPKTLQAMITRQNESAAIATLATSIIDDPTGYGRIVRDGHGDFEAIVEQKNASPAQLAIHEVYPSYACFKARDLFTSLAELAPNETTGEYYITDIPMMMKTKGNRVEVVDAVPPEDVLSVNTPEQLIEVDAILRTRHVSPQPQTAGEIIS